MDLKEDRHLGSPPLDSEAARLTFLEESFAAAALKVEFYFVGGAVLYQAFAASPGTAHIDALFRPAVAVREAIRDVAAATAAPADWLPQSVRAAVAAGPGPGAYVELEHLSIFAPRPEYVLAVKCAATRLGDAFQEADDIRYVLRAMNLTSVDEALSVVGRYYSDRQLPADLRTRLEAVLTT